jgi:hypothetical protein
MPINPYLFGILQRVDPETQVVNEGEAAVYAQAPQAAGYNGRKAYPVVDSWGEGYRLNCPFCGDYKRRLFFCHLAGAKAKVPKRATPLQFSNFVCVCHNEHCNSQRPEFREWLKALEIDKGPVLDLSQTFSPKKMEGYGFLFAVEEDRLPSPCYPLTSPEVPAAAVQYLIKRGFDPYWLQAEYGCGYSPDGAVYARMSDQEYQDGLRSLRNSGKDTSNFTKTGKLWGSRIIIPVTQGRRLVGWQGRLFQDSGDRCPKYFTSPRLDKSKVLFNMDRAILGNLAVLVEGVFDVFRVGAPAMAMFGKSLSAMQQELLKLTFSQTGGCLVMLDPDAREDVYKLAMKLHEAGIFPRGVVPVYMPDPGPDPADCSAADVRALLDYYSEQLLESVPASAPKYSADQLLQGFEELETEEDE